MTARVYGWKRDLPDHRDRLHAHLTTGDIPNYSDLRSQLPEVWDQGQLGACTAFAACAVICAARQRQGLPYIEPAQLHYYYAERSIDPQGYVREDSGSSLRIAGKVSAKFGMSESKFWPYDISRFAQRPPKSAYVNALTHRALSYAKVPQTHDDFRRALAEGYPVMFGFSVYESFESDHVRDTGIVPLPDVHEEFLDGHAVVLCGHDDTRNRYTVRNSWSSSWGDKGYCYMPYAYVESPSLASDFWIVKQES